MRRDEIAVVAQAQGLHVHIQAKIHNHHTEAVLPGIDVPQCLGGDLGAGMHQ